MARRKSNSASEKKESSKGLGDTIEKITEVTGIKAAVEWFSETTGVDCGCDKRKEALNKAFPYKAKVECLEKDEYEYIGTIMNKHVITGSEQKRINEIYNGVFHEKVEATSCGSCIDTRIKRLKALHATYEKV